jgi:hypothetical protein
MLVFSEVLIDVHFAFGRYPDITEKLNEYVAQGLSKDEALQKAKLFYMDKNGGNLPYYWAGMVLIGNADPVQFPAAARVDWRVGAVMVGILLLVIGGALAFGRKRYYI